MSRSRQTPRRQQKQQWHQHIDPCLYVCMLYASMLMLVVSKPPLQGTGDTFNRANTNICTTPGAGGEEGEGGREAESFPQRQRLTVSNPTVRSVHHTPHHITTSATTTTTPATVYRFHLHLPFAAELAAAPTAHLFRSSSSSHGATLYPTWVYHAASSSKESES